MRYQNVLTTKNNTQRVNELNSSQNKNENSSGTRSGTRAEEILQNLQLTVRSILVI